MLTNKEEVIFFSSLGALLLFFFVGGMFLSHEVTKPPVVEVQDAPLVINSLDLKARAVYVLDLDTDKVLYAKNETARLPLASLTKLMSSLVASDIAPMDDVITISKEAIAEEGDSGLYLGERWQLRDLLDFSLITSANDGLKAIALSLENQGSDFVARMNDRANTLEMKDTYYLNETGLDLSKEKSGAYGSAKDEALLLAYILKYRPNLVAATREPSRTFVSLDNRTHQAINTNIILGDVPRVLASKTGYTDLAGGNLVMAFDAGLGHTIVISILGSTEEGRFEDMTEIVNSIISRS